jgi:hypothetical protein
MHFDRIQFYLTRFFPLIAYCLLLAAIFNAGYSSSRQVKKEGVREELEPAPVFIDITEEAGVAHLHHKPVLDPKVTNIAGWLSSVGASAAAGDYDQDGDIDLYVSNSQKGHPNALYRNDSNEAGTAPLHFTDVAEKAGVAWVNEEKGGTMDVVFGDYDNDGDLDLYVAKWGCNLLFRNNGDGTFKDVTEFAGVGDCGNANAVIFLDYNLDGFLDLFVGNYFDYIDLWNLPHTRFMHDGFETSKNAGPNLLYKNNGDGSFTDVADEAGVQDRGWILAAGAADYDNDGDSDIYVANDFGPDKLFRNERDGTFTDVSDAAIGFDTKKGMNAEFGDFNNDGWIDIYVSNITTKEYLEEGNMLHRNLGDGTFINVALETGTYDGGWSWGAKFFDYDNDGDLDIYNVNGFVSAGEEEYWFDLATTVTLPEFDPIDTKNWASIGDKSLSGYEESRLFRNEGNEIFTEVAKEAGVNHNGDGRGIVVADFDNDGDLDLFIANQGQKAVLYQNEVGNRNNWVCLKLIGTNSNRDGVGTRVTMVSGSLTQIREKDGGNGYAAQSDPRLFFGLGKRKNIDRIEIRWPSGTLQTLKEVSINQFLTIREEK